MQRFRIELAALFAALLLAAIPGHALADASTFRTEGVTMRLVAEGPDASGRLRGAVVLDLDPGWKTYWIDPGAAGLAPTLDFSASENVAAPSFSFPPPGRFSEGDIGFNGYDAPMAIAFDALADRGKTPRLSVKVFAGICRDICVPVSAELRSAPAAATPFEDAMAIERAFLALPSTERNHASAREQGGELILSDLPPGGTGDDLFVSGPPGWSFGRPHRDGPEWRVPVRSRAAGASSPALEGILIEAERARRFVIDIR